MKRKLRSISRRKKPVNRNITFAEIDFNNNHSTDLILVETFFGSMETLSSMLGSKYLCSESNYYVIMRMCIALTKFHIYKHLLREYDGVAYQNWRRRLYNIGYETSKKRERQQKTYLDQHRARLCGDSDYAIFAN